MEKKLVLAGVLLSFALLLALGAAVHFSTPQAQEEQPQEELSGRNAPPVTMPPFANITIVPKNTTKPPQMPPSLPPANLTSEPVQANATSNATNTSSPSGGSSSGGSSSSGGGSSGGGSSGGSEPPVGGSGTEPSAEIAPESNTTNYTNNTYYYPMMNAAIAEAKCRIDFVLAVLKAAREEEVHAGYAALLYQDLTHLEEYAQQNDIHAFNGYRGSLLVEHMKDAWEAARQAKANRNYTLEAKDLLRTEYKNAEDAYLVCHAGAMGSYANAKISLYEHILENYKAKINTLKNKVNTTHLLDLIKEARGQIIAPLKKAVLQQQSASASDAAYNYCLFEGCTEEGAVNFHFLEKYNIAKMGAIMEALQQKAYSANLGASKAKNVRDSLAQMNEHIQDAKEAVDSAGDFEMTPEQKEAVMKYLLQAQGLAKEVLGILNS